MSSIYDPVSNPHDGNSNTDQTVSNDDTGYLVIGDSQRFERWRSNFVQTQTWRDIKLLITGLVIIGVIAAIIIGLTILTMQETSAPTPAPTLSTMANGTHLMFEFNTTQGNGTQTYAIVKSLPTCPYKDWYRLSCPKGDTWACWGDESKRNEENCSQWGKIYAWATLNRTWPKTDCYCCSQINCTFP